MYNTDVFYGPEQIIKNCREAISNAKQFNADLGNSKYLIDNLSKFRDWYYFREYDIWAPKKFIGFRDMTSEKYELLKKDPKSNKRGNFDSSLLGPILNRISYLALRDEKLELRKQLTSYLNQYDKEPRRGAVLYIIH